MAPSHSERLLLCFILSLSVELHPVVSEVSPSWGSCSSYQVRPNTTFRARWRQVSAGSQAACQDACTASEACGSYTLVNGRNCNLHSISIRLIQEHNLPASIIATEQDQIVGSKTCAPSVRGTECNSFPVRHERTYIKPSWMVAAIFPIPYTDLRIEQCQTYCSLHTECQSVAYHVDGTRGECDLYNTTVGQLQALGLNDEYGTDPFQGKLPELVTLDRYCGDTPYQPPDQGSLSGAASLRTSTFFQMTNHFYRMFPSVLILLRCVGFGLYG